MTGWNWPGTRHVPEDELHAYLDQALSRSQCVEIECHLAECRHCQTDRDRVAAARDRITALLAEAEPGRITAPPFEQLIARRQARVVARRISFERIARVGLAAAILLAAVGTGWWSRGRLDGRSTVGVPTQVAADLPIVTPPRDSATTEAALPETDAPESRTLLAVSPMQIVEPAIDRSRGQLRLTPAVMRVVGGQSVQVSSLGADDDAPALDGLWQSVGWQEATALSGGNLPRIEGLPVVDIELQRGLADERPLVVVAQQHPSGRIIRTIEGPVDRVAALLDKQMARQSSRLRASAPSLTEPDYIADGSELPRRGLRVMTVTGNFSADSLNALVRGIDLRQ
jgi:anti-sigma factor RsiW